MKKSFFYERKVVLDTDDPYRPVTYTHGISVELNEREMDETKMATEEIFEILEDEINDVQRTVIKEETGVTVLPIDKLKKIDIRRKLLKKE